MKPGSPSFSCSLVLFLVAAFMAIGKATSAGLTEDEIQSLTKKIQKDCQSQLQAMEGCKDAIIVSSSTNNDAATTKESSSFQSCRDCATNVLNEAFVDGKGQLCLALQDEVCIGVNECPCDDDDSCGDLVKEYFKCGADSIAANVGCEVFECTTENIAKEKKSAPSSSTSAGASAAAAAMATLCWSVVTLFPALLIYS